MPTSTRLDVLSLGSYIMLLGMDYLHFIGLRWIVMKKPLSAWMTMKNRESCRVRRRKHQLGW